MHHGKGEGGDHQGEGFAIGAQPAQEQPPKHPLLGQGGQHAADDEAICQRVAAQGLHGVGYRRAPQSADGVGQKHRDEVGEVERREGHEEGPDKLLWRQGAFLRGLWGGQRAQNGPGHRIPHQIDRCRRQCHAEPRLLHQRRAQQRQQEDGNDLHRNGQRQQGEQRPPHAGEQPAVLPVSHRRAMSAVHSLPPPCFVGPFAARFYCFLHYNAPLSPAQEENSLSPVQQSPTGTGIFLHRRSRQDIDFPSLHDTISSAIL